MNDAKIATPRVGPRELVQTTLAVLALVGLLAAAGAVLWPFLGASLWAAMIVVATWPIHRAVERRVGHRRWLSVTIMSLGLMLLLLVPAVLLVDGLIDAVPRLAGLLRDVLNGPLPDPPAWLVSLPGVGDQLAGAWRELTDAGLTEITRHLSPYAGLLSRFALGQIGGLGYVLLHLLMTLVIAAVFYAQGEAAAQLLRRLGRRLAGNQGEGAVLLAGQAIQGVALGVGGTA